MKLGHVGYHSFRGYAPDSASAIARETAETVWLVKGDETHFSVLGSAGDDKLLGAVAPCPFPEDQARTRGRSETGRRGE